VAISDKQVELTMTRATSAGNSAARKVLKGGKMVSDSNYNQEGEKGSEAGRAGTASPLYSCSTLSAIAGENLLRDKGGGKRICPTGVCRRRRRIPSPPADTENSSDTARLQKPSY